MIEPSSPFRYNGVEYCEGFELQSSSLLGFHSVRFGSRKSLIYQCVFDDFGMLQKLAVISEELLIYDKIIRPPRRYSQGPTKHHARFLDCVCTVCTSSGFEL